KVNLTPQSATIPRFNGQRMNEVQGYVQAGVLPATVVTELKTLLEQAGFELPPGYSMEWGGEAAKRNDAVGNLMANVGLLMVMMVATLVLSFASFRIAGIIGVVAFLSAGLGVGALWLFGYPFGFMAIVGTMGLVGVAINDTIVVLAAIRENDQASQGQPAAVREVVMRSTRHVVATSLTTMAGFVPLLLGGGGFWPPLAVAVAGGVGGATILALYFAPSAYILAMCRNCAASEQPSEITLSLPQRESELPEPVLVSG
ncbi:MAG: efflux RND transporter permease subunit, partial [Pirellulales bacterium]|nr:efflux RND transporter permease subunit [Pirellulales bacterium]